MGTAFDYLIRFHLQRTHPHAIVRPWVAEHAVEVLTRSNRRRGKEVVELAREQVGSYVTGREAEPSVALIKSALDLAGLDIVYRAGERVRLAGRRHDPLDVEDLKALLALIPPVFKARCSVCVLNPSFGEGSALVGGADGDILIDKTLIDIKVVVDSKFLRAHYNQLIGYSLLSEIGGVDEALFAVEIQELAIYYARFGRFRRFSVPTLVDAKRKSFLGWFTKRARRHCRDLGVD